MSHVPLNTPVVLLIFNRPQLTAQVMLRLRQVRPPMLLLVADGPRGDRPGEAERCAAARSAVLDHIDWPCQVRTNLADANLGLRPRVASGITWAFSQVERAIILEDDCVPDPTFFRFCQELLERYAEDRRVMHIGGHNLAPSRPDMAESYLFSRYPHCWGWATWRRAWALYDAELSLWPAIRQGDRLRRLLGNDRALTCFWRRQIQRVADGKLSSWATIWTLSCWAHHGLSILPSVNLMNNVGLGDPDATHTRDGQHLVCPSQAMAFPLVHPAAMVRDAARDHAAEVRQFGIRWTYRLSSLIRD